MTTLENIERLDAEQSANLDRIEEIQEQLAELDTTTEAQVEAMLAGKPTGTDREVQIALKQEIGDLKDRNNLIDIALGKLYQQKSVEDHQRDVERVAKARTEYGKRITKTLRAFIDAHKLGEAAKEVFESVRDVNHVIRGRFQPLGLPGGWHATDIKDRESVINYIIREGIREGYLDPANFQDCHFDLKNPAHAPSQLPAGVKVNAGLVPFVTFL